MTKYMFLYWQPASNAPWNPSPEEMQQVFAKWSAWKQKFSTQVVDLGDGLKPGATFLRGGERTDGPFPEAKEIVNGFSIVQATSIDEAIKVARDCPINMVPGSHIEIREMKGY